MFHYENAQNLLMIKFSGTLTTRLISGAMYFEMPTFSIHSHESRLFSRIPSGQHGTNSVGAKNVGSLAHIVRRISGTQEIREMLRRKKRQAAIFGQTYHSRLAAEDCDFLAQFVQARSGPLFYWRNRRLFHDIYRLAGMMLLG